MPLSCKEADLLEENSVACIEGLSHSIGIVSLDSDDLHLGCDALEVNSNAGNQTTSANSTEDCLKLVQVCLARLEKLHDLTNIPPFDDPYVIAGQGTIGMELLRQANLDKLEACSFSNRCASSLAASKSIP
jgi:hypothetical protein